MKVSTEDINKYMIIPNKFIAYQIPNIIVLKKHGREYLFYSQAINIRIKNLKRAIKRLFFGE